MSTATYSELWDYAVKPQELFLSCNLCGSMCESKPAKDRLGFDVGVSQCEDCGLVFLNPRMTAQAYGEFYRSGAYRRLVSAYHGREITPDTLMPEQREYGMRMRKILEPWLTPEHRTLLDIGGSTGTVARVFAEECGLIPVILDPSLYELLKGGQFAYVKGIGYQALEFVAHPVEDFDPRGRTWDVILLCQTIDHLLDPMGTLRKVRRMLAPDGVFWVDALDYDRTKLLKIDHPFNLTESTMRDYLHRTGFGAREVVRHGDHVGFVCQGAR